MMGIAPAYVLETLNMHVGTIRFLPKNMYEFSESGPERKKSPHEEFSYSFYCLLTRRTKELFPEQSINYGYLCNGDRKISRISFTHEDGGASNESDWVKLKEHACDIFSETVTLEDISDEISSENTTISFSDADPEYNGDQTIIISEV